MKRAFPTPTPQAAISLCLVILAATTGYLFLQVQHLTSKLSLTTAKVELLATSTKTTANVAAPVKIDPKVFPPVSASDHSDGSLTGKVTLVEYTDFECPFCQRFEETKKQLLEKYGSNLHWVYRNLPISSHAGAQPKAVVAECIAANAGNDMYLSYVNYTYTTGWLAKPEDVEAQIGTFGITAQQLAACKQDSAILTRITNDAALASKMGITATPSSVLISPDGSLEVIVGALPITTLTAKIDAALAVK